MNIRIFFYVLLAASCSACAHVADVKNKPSLTVTQESPVMNTTANTNETFKPSSLTDYYNVTPEELGKRFLKLLDSINSVDELSLGHVQNIMQVPLKLTPSRSYDFSIHLPDSGWYYRFSYTEDPINYNAPVPQGRKGISLDFENYDNRSADMAPVCGMDFDAYTTALKALGFNISPEYDSVLGQRGPLIQWNLNRSSAKTSLAGLSGNMLHQSQAPEPENKFNHACLKSIGVGGVTKP
jgi:hypothetical protein